MEPGAGSLLRHWPLQAIVKTVGLQLRQRSQRGMIGKVAYATCFSLMLSSLAECSSPISATMQSTFRGEDACAVHLHQRRDAILSGGVVKRIRILQKDRSAVLHQELEKLKVLPRTSR